MINKIQPRVKSGWCRIAFTMAFYFLLRMQDLTADQAYELCIRETVRHAGDSDTNACIVGAMIGAAVGIDKIPR